MGRPKRLYPLGVYRLRIRGEVDKDTRYPIELMYTWNRKVVRKTTNFFVRAADWNQNANNGRGELRPGYGEEYRRHNSILMARVDKIDTMLADYQQKHPNEITADLIADLLADKPITRADKGKDLIEFTLERLKSDYSRNVIKRSRYLNGISGMNIFQEFLRSTGRGTLQSDRIYVSELTPELIDAYIEWRREVKKNKDATINHALTPLLKASAYAAEMHMIEPAVNARIQNMRIVVKPSLSDEESEFDGKYLTTEEIGKVIAYYKECPEPRRKEFLEMFMFAFHACGLRVVDVMTLKWSNVNFEKKELRKIMIKTSKRHVIPLTEPAIAILRQWREKRPDSKFVFNLMKDTIDIDDQEALYSARNNATKCINQSLTVVGEQLGFRIPLTMHVARHSFAVLALNSGLSMSVVSRLLGHGSTDVTEKVYARFLPETLSAEVHRLDAFTNSLTLN